jgi:tRNA pseudouridine38-40 synthase
MDADTFMQLPSGLKRLSPEGGIDDDQPKRVKIDGHESTAEGTNVIDPAPPKEKFISRRRDAAGWAKSRKGKEKDGKNAGRRRGMHRDDSIPEGRGGSHTEDHAQKAQRLPKRQCALLIGYCGTGYNGMQMCVHAWIIQKPSHDSILWQFNNVASVMCER